MHYSRGLTDKGSLTTASSLGLISTRPDSSSFSKVLLMWVGFFLCGMEMHWLNMATSIPLLKFFFFWLVKWCLPQRVYLDSAMTKAKVRGRGKARETTGWRYIIRDSEAESYGSRHLCRLYLPCSTYPALQPPSGKLMSTRGPIMLLFSRDIVVSYLYCGKLTMLAPPCFYFMP
jgi:hypothetical protein